eukprot:3309934-Alexandrium_andersonii.AAC.1
MRQPPVQSRARLRASRQLASSNERQSKPRSTASGSRSVRTNSERVSKPQRCSDSDRRAGGRHCVRE